MRRVGSATVDEMVLAFLQGEVDSPEFGQYIQGVLGGDLRVVHEPQDTPEHITRRRYALACCRGFEMNTSLFRGFPADADWSRIALTRDDVGELRYGKYPDWITLSGLSRLVREGARNVRTTTVDEGLGAKIRAVEKEVAAGRLYPDLILAATTPESEHVILEGHTRATAYYLALDSDVEIEMIAADSRAMSECAWF